MLISCGLNDKGQCGSGINDKKIWIPHFVRFKD